MTHWSDVLGDVSAADVLRLHGGERGACTTGYLADWLRLQSKELWDGENWQALAAQIEREGMHGSWTLDDVKSGFAGLVRCPDCNQQEIWCNWELDDHGLCRAKGGPCSVC